MSPRLRYEDLFSNLWSTWEVVISLIDNCYWECHWEECWELSPFSVCLFAFRPWGKVVCAIWSCHVVIPAHILSSNGTKWLQIMSNNKPFIFLSLLSQLFCCSNQKRTNALTIGWIHFQPMLLTSPLSYVSAWYPNRYILYIQHSVRFG